MFDNFCSDIVALFFNHLFSCDGCFVKFLLLMFGVGASVLGFFKLLSFILDKLDSWSYKERYLDMKNRYESVYNDFYELSDRYLDLEKDYYHTCN